MSRAGDHLGEMRRHRPDLDAALEAALAGRQPDGEHGAVATALVEGVRFSLATPPPRPGTELAAVLTEGLATDHGDLPVTADSNVHGPATQVAGLPKWRRPRMLEVVLAKLAALGLGAKLGIAGAAVAAASTGAGAAGGLPGPAQDAFDRATAAVTGQELPDEAELPDGANVPDDPGAPADVGQPDEVGEAPVDPDPDRVDEGVRGVIEGTDPEDRGGDSSFGEDVADEADQNRQDEDATEGVPSGEGGADAADNEFRSQQQPDDPPTDVPSSDEVPEDTPDSGESGQDTADDNRP